MKYIVKIFVVTFFLIFSTQAFAEQKIVVLDLTYVLNSSKAGKGAQDFLKEKFNDNNKKHSELEKSLKKEENDLLETRADLTAEEYKQKADELRKKVVDYQNERRASLDKLATQRANARKILMEKLKPIVDSYIKENEIALVIDKKNMLGGSSKYDITELIVEKLNKELPSIDLK
tara:strand:+ start:2791 stop:3315 length:525 start_codon:yes stop_codon:yes gene_type:complete